MNVSNVSRYVVSAIVALVLILITFELFPLVQQNADEFLQVFRTRCTVGENQNFTRAFGVDTSGEIVTEPVVLKLKAATEAASITCVGAHSTPDVTFTLLTGKTVADINSIADEHGEQLRGLTYPTAAKITGSITNGALTPPLPVTQFLGGLSQLIIRIIPIVSVVSFLAISAGSLFSYSMGASSHMRVTVMIGSAVGGLIAIIVVLNLMPTLFTGLQDVYVWVSADRLIIMDQFGDIAALIVRFVPPIISASILGVIASQNWLAFRNARGAMG